MAIDGNDDRGIDVGILLKVGHELVSTRSHVDETDARGQVFSGDCPEYTVKRPDGTRIIVLVSHLKSKGYGSQRDNDARRRRQALRAAALDEALGSAGEDHFAVVGDFNDDTPD